MRAINCLWIILQPRVCAQFRSTWPFGVRANGSAGYTVVAPDYFEGDALLAAKERLGSEFNMETWIFPALARAKETAPVWIEAAIQEFGWCISVSQIE